MKTEYTPEELEMQADALLEDADADIVDHSEGETIACKTGRKNKALFRRLCEKQMGCTMNEALQMVIDCLIRHMDDRHNLDEELNTMINLFEGFKQWGNHINLTEPIERNAIIAAIYILAHPVKVGRRMVMVDGADGELTRTETFNLHDMLEVFLNAYDEQLYRDLRTLGVRMGTGCMDETFRKLIREYRTDDEDDDTIRQMFEDNKRDDFGREMADAPYRRTMNNSMDNFEARESREDAWWRSHQIEIDFDSAGDETINDIY